jgi:thiamine-monophosphate kinase
MAGTPLASVISVVLPADCSWENSEALRIGLGAAAAEFGAPLVGGDISIHRGSKETGDACGPLTIAVTVLALPPSGGAVLRSGAMVGDRIFVSGALGGAWLPDGTGHHLSFTPRVELGQTLKATLGSSLHAMMDISDGLGKDASRIGVASGAVVVLQAVDVPCRTPELSWTSALSDGEDYELVFCVDAQSTVPDTLLGVPLTCVGAVEACGDRLAGAQVRTPDNQLLDASADGWDHGA